MKHRELSNASDHISERTTREKSAKLLDTKIAVPALPEQRRIAAEHDALLPSILDRAFSSAL